MAEYLRRTKMVVRKGVTRRFDGKAYMLIYSHNNKRELLDDARKYVEHKDAAYRVTQSTGKKYAGKYQLWVRVIPSS